MTSCLKQVQKELQDAQQRAEREGQRAAKKQNLELEVVALKRQLEEARKSKSCAREGPAAAKAHVGMQVDKDDIFDLMNSRCEHLRRAFQQSEQGKIAAEAYSIQTKAQLARAEHATKGLSEEMTTWKQQSRLDLEHAHEAAQIAREEAQKKAKAREALVQKHFLVANRVLHEQIRQLRDTVQSLRGSAAICNGNCREDVDRLSLQLEVVQRFDWTGKRG